jgi:hypothetical protein
MTRFVLFSSQNLGEVISHRRRGVIQEIAQMEPNRLLNTSVDDLAGYLAEKYKLDTPQLQESEITVDQKETQVDVSRDPLRNIPDPSRPYYISGTLVTYYIPFTGDQELFRCRASSYSTNSPQGNVEDNQLVLIYEVIEHDSAAVRQQFDSELANLKRYLEWIEIDARNFNSTLREYANEQIEKRRDRLLKDQGLVAELGFPLRQRPGMPQTYTAPSIRRKLELRPPAAKTQPFVPEPTLAMAEYEHILNVVRNMVIVMEQSPRAFKDMQEEELRQHFLVQLNGHYRGQATGETFNYEGKTDILIRVDGKNIFIAECKFWDGPKSLTDAVDQVLRYATWRDTKVAVFVFNRTRNFSRVVSKIAEVVEAHPNFKRSVPYAEETGFRAVLSHPDDPNRELLMTVLAFDIPN